ncbi:MAG TPA: LuxR C-terminal-related transcriptional regulator [Candidatus Angelobacter sp.]|nr:LuxR C-terminal-related transcriptional regulator [Candidatus Angelobacter sp.]
MDHLLIVPLQKGIPQGFLELLRQSGWWITVTTDAVRAKQLLHKGDVSGVMIEFSGSDQDADRLKVLKFVHEFCPTTQVIIFYAGADLIGAATQTLVRTLQTADGERTTEPHAALDLYNLTPAQKRIALLVAEAYPNREIAQRLKIKEQSVRNEVSRIFKKIGVWNRVELALLVRNGSPQTGGKRDLHATAATESWPEEFAPQTEKSVASLPASSLLPAM